MIYDNVPPMDTWVELEKLVDERLVRHIGLSNFNSQQVDEVRPSDPYSICLLIHCSPWSFLTFELETVAKIPFI